MNEHLDDLNPDLGADEKSGIAESIQRKLAEFEGVNDTNVRGLIGELKDILSKLQSGLISPDEFRKVDARITEIFNELGQSSV